MLGKCLAPLKKAIFSEFKISSPLTTVKEIFRKDGFFTFILSSFFFGSTLTGCAVFTVRPVQEMSDTTAALRAAKEVQADLLAPELFRQANEWYLRARNEYQLKNFAISKDFANKARMYAETAEFESIRNGGNRSSTESNDPGQIPPPPQDSTPPPPPPAETSPVTSDIPAAPSNDATPPSPQ